MKKSICLILAFCALLSLFGCASVVSDPIGVYKYYSSTLTSAFYAGDDADVFTILGVTIGKSIFEGILKDSYVEVHPDLSVSFYSPISGAAVPDFGGIIGSSDGAVDYDIDGDLLIISADGIVVTYKKASKEDAAIYKKLIAAEEAGKEASRKSYIPLGDYYCISMEDEDGVYVDGIDVYICLEDEESGYRHTAGNTIDFHYTYNAGVLKITTPYGESITGTYDDGIITLDVSGHAQIYDANYTAPVFPAASWAAIVYIDPQTGDAIDLPTDDLAVRMYFNSDGSGKIYSSDSVDGEPVAFEWEQRGNAVIATDENGNRFEGLYEDGYLYGFYLDGELVFELG